MKIFGSAGRTAGAATLALALLSLPACGGGDTGSGAESPAGGEGGGIATEIKMGAVHDLTGPIAYAGVGARDGAQVAIEEITTGKFLGEGVTVSIEEVDSANEIERATSEMTRMAGRDDIVAIIGPAASQQAAAVAPLVEREKVPTVFTQAGAQGVVIGEYTFRATAPMDTYYDKVPQYLKTQGLTNIAVLVNSSFPTFDQLAQSFTGKAQSAGLNVVTTVPVQSSTQDFTAPAAQIASAKPDAVVMFLIAPQSVTAMTQTRQAGYRGQFVGTSVQASGNVSEAGEAADGVIYPVPFSASMQTEKAKAFTNAFQKKFNRLPDPYAADGYDAMWWIARGIQASNDSSREGIKNGMLKVGQAGFEGAGGDYTFEGGRDLRVGGRLAQWKGSAESMLD